MLREENIDKDLASIHPFPSQRSTRQTRFVFPQCCSAMVIKHQALNGEALDNRIARRVGPCGSLWGKMQQKEDNGIEYHRMSKMFRV